MRQIVQTIYDDPGERRVIIFQRNDGTFGFDEEHLSNEDSGLFWFPSYEGWHTICFADTLETVLREVYGRVRWLYDPDEAECGKGDNTQ
ncbi:MAG: hypothetical protein KY468_05815 [Armatimonadetes bacterium]|nr:hypothetical protein [Armatimonadota bacterium]